jgi:hypothetical protein
MPIAALFAAATLVLSGCAPTPPDRADFEENFREPETAPEFFPDGTAEQNLPYFNETMRQFAVGTAAVQGKPVVDALASAGFEKADMQVSFDESKTELAADSIFVSVRLGTDCLIGQIVVADRSFVTEAADAVGPDQGLCLIGATRPIDW